MTVQSILASHLRGRMGAASYIALKILGVELPRSVQIGRNLQLPHGSVGLVVHPKTSLGDNVKLFGGVTLGRADSYYDASEYGNDESLVNVTVEDDVIVGSGAKVLFSASKGGRIRLGRGSVIAANAVVLEDVGPGEIWGGVPARRIR